MEVQWDREGSTYTPKTLRKKGMTTLSFDTHMKPGPKEAAGFTRRGQLSSPNGPADYSSPTLSLGQRYPEVLLGSSWGTGPEKATQGVKGPTKHTGG